MSETPRKLKANGHIVQADWNQTDPLKMDYIQNKPEIVKAETLTGKSISLSMLSNIEYHCINPIEYLSIEGFIAGREGVADQWSIVFSTGNNISIEYDDVIIWAYAEPIWEANKYYWLSIIPLNNKYLGIWTVADIA